MALLPPTADGKGLGEKPCLEPWSGVELVGSLAGTSVEMAWSEFPEEFEIMADGP